jgi:hypothetical protein
MKDKVQTVAQRFINRAASLKSKGKRRDAAALDFFEGASVGALLAGDAQLARYIMIAAAQTVLIKGFTGIQKLAAG